MSSTVAHTIELSAEQYNPTQILLMEERLILLDADDKPIGEASKKDAHLIPPPVDAAKPDERGKSALHRAFSVFLFHPESGKLLLQKRADEKITFPAMWTNTCCSHPLSFPDEAEEGPRQVGVRRAAGRKLDHELGIPNNWGDGEEFAYLTRIHYYAPSDDVWAEHEIDYILFATQDPSLNPSPNEVSDTRWVSKAELEEFFQDPNPSIKFTPWFMLIARSFLYEWWDLLLETRDPKTGLLDAKKLVPEVEKRSTEMGQIIRM